MNEPTEEDPHAYLSYLMTDGQEQAWARLYREAAEWKHDRRWEPPKKYGLRADDWPLPGKVVEPEPFRLRLIASGGERLI
ncbi:hypothetical protein D0Z67_29300 (plasmid) [Streptomyces seoulensis]|uniref:Uncharacterized protein n=1 Tax=Streptomyces seoulensis TaxID=73044 RepID=A0A4P6U813_STRSO|nr:hypothetical protein [Streptomyces seoulensis]QBJ94468.1 hypothetical protein D0Z67_29300 [Streptomyces seoulensis]